MAMKFTLTKISDKRYLLVVPLVVAASVVGVQAAQDTGSYTNETGLPTTEEQTKLSDSETSVGTNNQQITLDAQQSTDSAAVNTQQTQGGGDTATTTENPPEETTPEPEPVVMVSAAQRFTELSAENQAKIKSPPPDGSKYMEQYCDYTYSNGSSNSVFQSVVTVALPGSGSGTSTSVKC